MIIRKFLLPYIPHWLLGSSMMRGSSPVRCFNSKLRMLRSSSHSRAAFGEAFFRSISTWQPLCCKYVTRTFLKNAALPGLSHEKRGEYFSINKFSNSLSKWGFGPLFKVSFRKCSIFLSTRGLGGGPWERPARYSFAPPERCWGDRCCCRMSCPAGARRPCCWDPRRPIPPIEPPMAPIPPELSNKLLFGNCSSPSKERIFPKVSRIPESRPIP
mmetsp:Transcript_11346/g.28679  ORF Transcript_11346/g.28679 Transcript_11346/m.28679 type:complete len:214 (-) Transcript_11346:2577-3218(-)